MKKRYFLILFAIFILASCDGGSSEKGSKTKSSEKLLTELWFSADNSANRQAGITSDLTASINGNDISLTLPFGIQATTLSASFTVAQGASVSVNGVSQLSGSTVNSFVYPLVYTVNSKDGKTESYKVTVNTQWVKTMGTEADDKGKFHTDSNGNIYAIISSEKYLESGELEKKGPYLRKYSPEFTELWSLKMPDQNYYCYGIQTDKSGNIYIRGKFIETVDFNPGEAKDLITASGDSDGFITKILPDGTYGWTKAIGSSLIWEKDEAITGVITDSDGSIYYSGLCYAPTDFDPGPGTDIQAPPYSTYNYIEYSWVFSYITKLKPDGTYAWTRITRPGGGTSIEDMAVDSGNNLLFAGYLRTNQADFDPGPGVDYKSPNGWVDSYWGDAYWGKYKNDGSYCWTKSFGGEDVEIARKIFLDKSDNTFVSGFFKKTVDFDPGDGIDMKTDSGYGDCPYITKYNSDGNYAWTKILDSDLGGFAVVIGTGTDSAGNIYSLLNQSSYEPMETKIKLTKINPNGTTEWIKTIISSQYNYLTVNDFNVDENGIINLAGYFSGLITINTGTDVIQKTSAGESDIFAIKVAQ